jgi:hypothetical protein
MIAIYTIKDLFKTLLSDGSINTTRPNTQQSDECYKSMLGNSYVKTDKPINRRNTVFSTRSAPSKSDIEIMLPSNAAVNMHP